LLMSVSPAKHAPRRRGRIAPPMVYAAVVETVRQFPHATLSGIVQELTDAGLRTAKGGRFSTTLFARIIEALGIQKIDGRCRAVRMA